MSSDKTPIGTLQFAASSLSSSISENSVTAVGLHGIRTALENIAKKAYPYCLVMLSTPAPTPISIIPDLMALAMSTQAIKPELHCLFKLLTAVVVGKPATIAAARNSV